MNLELGKTEYLCKFLSYIWPVTDPSMEENFGGVLILWAQNYIA